MDETPDRLPTSRSEFLKMVEASPYAEVLRDETRLRAAVIDALKQSEDPVTREIGEGLSGGTMTWTTIATTSAYADFLQRGCAALRQFDLAKLAADLSAAPDPRPAVPARRDDSEEDLWQGLRRRRR